tara:strand:+ start:2223 stop:2339 length:117 start_codon:yes stop_codon:yes gene_type:complete
MGKVNLSAINIDIGKKRSKRRFLFDMIKMQSNTDDGCD